MVVYNNNEVLLNRRRLKDKTREFGQFLDFFASMYNQLHLHKIRFTYIKQ